MACPPGRSSAWGVPASAICGSQKAIASLVRRSCRCDVGEAHRVRSRDPALIGRFVQQRPMIVDVAGAEDGRVSALRGRGVDARRAARVEGHARRLEVQPLDVGAPTRRHQHRGEALVVRRAVRGGPVQPDTVGLLAGGAHVDPEPEVELRRQVAARDALELRIGERADPVRAVEERHAHAEPRHRLSQLEGDDAGADDGETFGQVGELEDVVARDRAVAEAVERGRHVRPAPGGDDDGAGLDTHAIIDHQRRGTGEAGVTAQPVLLGDRLRVADGEGDEAVALVADPLEHRRSVDSQRAARMHAEAVRPGDGVRRLGRGDEQLRGHAPDARARGAIRAVLDEERTAARALDLAAGVEARRARTDDRDVDPSRLHPRSDVAPQPTPRTAVTSRRPTSSTMVEWLWTSTTHSMLSGWWRPRMGSARRGGRRGTQHGLHTRGGTDMNSTAQRSPRRGLVLAAALVAASFAASPAHAVRPMIFVHGGSGSGAQFESQAMRYASNGYPARLRPRARVRLAVRPRQPGAGGRGARRAGRSGDRRDGRRQGRPAGAFARHVHLADLPERRRARRQDRALRQHRRRDRRPRRRAASPRWRSGAPGTRPARSWARRTCTLPNQTHVQSATSPESFAAQYEFLNGAPPATTSILPEARVQLVGPRGDLPAEPRRRRRDARDLRGRRRHRRAAAPGSRRHLPALEPARRVRAVRGDRRPALRVRHPARRRPPAPLLHPAGRAQRPPDPASDRRRRHPARRRHPGERGHERRHQRLRPDPLSRVLGRPGGEQRRAPRERVRTSSARRTARSASG